MQRLVARSSDWVRRVRTPEQVQAALEQARAGAPPPPRLDPFRGQDLGGFLPERLLGYRLGCSEYLALDTKTQDHVLLHVFELGHPERGSELRRVAERAERASRVEHPGLTLAVGAGRTKDTAFVAHQLPLGPTVADLVERKEALTPSAVRILLQQVGAALEALHARQLVHGDVCLRTVRREADGSFVLTDPGLARPRAELAFLGGELLGTPGFIAPEALDSGQVEPGADLFALGRVAWALLSRRPPPGAGELETASGIAAQLEAPLPPVPGAPPALTTVISKLSERDPTLRYRDAAELLADLSALDEGKNLLPRGLEDGAPGAPKGPETSKAPEAPRAATVLLVLLLMLDLILAVTMGITYWRVERMPLRDPVAGYTMPLPGVSEGGYVAEPKAAEVRGPR